MEGTRNCTIAIGTIQEAGKQANSIIYTMYEGYFSQTVVEWPILMPHLMHMCVLLPVAMPYVKHAPLGLHIGVRLKGRTTHIWFFACIFACATIMGCSGSKLSFGIIIVS